MTNGEKIKEIFPSVQITECKSYIQVMGENYEFNNVYPLVWWNAEYKEPNKSENPNSSTTNNDIGVDKLLADCEKMSFEIEIFNKPLRVVALDAVKNIVKGLSSVTPQEPKRGHWMGDSYGYICSNCEHSLNDLAQSMDYIAFSKPKYCPNCGAKMESEG